MADHVGFEGANIVYQAPENDENCGDLECFSDGRVVISCWRLTKEELEQVNETGVVWLSVKSTVIYPVLVSGNALVQIGDRPSKAEPKIPKRPRQ